MKRIIFLYKMLQASLTEKIDIRTIHAKYPRYSYNAIKKACREIVRYYVDPSHITLNRVIYRYSAYVAMFEAIVKAMKDEDKAI
jgi:hypothetical protein